MAMARVVLADGKITSEERALLDAYADSQGYTRAEVGHALNRVKGDLYQEASSRSARSNAATGT